MYKKLIVVGIIFILCSSFVTSISGYDELRGEIETNIENSNKEQDNFVISCNIYGIPGKSSNQIKITKSETDILFGKIKEYAKKLALDSTSKETEQLQEEIISLAKEYGLLDKDLSFEELQPRFSDSINKKRPTKITSLLNQTRGSAFFCNFATAGTGMQFPIIIFPRLIPILMTPIPRAFLHWSANDGFTSCGGMLSGKGYIAYGMQRGTALGFWGIGFSVFLPPFMQYGFIGYALYATCTSEEMEPWPPNYAPEISAVYPHNEAKNIPVSTSELSFQIQDDNGDLMDYTVTTNPDIGSGSGTGKSNGIYTIPISRLEGTEEYTWTVGATDGLKTTINSYSFSTEATAPIVTETNPKDGMKYVAYDISQLSFHLKDPQGDLMDYTVETSPNIGSSSGGGVGEGTYSVEIGSLENLTIYKWYVNVTDGENWKHKIFTFQTEPTMTFDPFEDGWQYRKKITIDHTQVECDLENFPVLVSTIDSDLKDKAQNNGDDILFMDGPGIANRLYHEIEYFDSSNGELVAWINLSKVESEEDTIFYLYYGNPSCTNQQTTERTWDSNYKAVYHMNQDSGGLIDSTSYDNNCDTVLGSPEHYKNGQIGYAIDFEKSYNEAFEDGEIFDGLDEMSVEAWINLESYHSTHCIIASHEDAWYFHVHRELDAVIFGTHGGVHNSMACDNIICPLEEWYYVVGTWSDSFDRMQLFGNGKLKDTYIETLSMQSSNDHFAIGYQDNNGNYFDGKLDELRISDIERAESWISTTYNNQNNPNDFMSLGLEESGP